MGVGRSSSLRTTADRSPLHDVRQPAARDRGSTRYKFDAWTSCVERALRVIVRSTVTPLQILHLRLAWWSQTGSNRRPPACKAGALPTELWPRLRTLRALCGGPGKTRTSDLTLIKRAL